MLFTLIIIIFLFIFYIALFGDYKDKEIEKDYKHMEEMLNGNRKK